MAKGNKTDGEDSGLNFEAQLLAAANYTRGQMDASKYKHFCLGPIFPKYTSDTFDGKMEQLLFGFSDPKGGGELYASQCVVQQLVAIIMRMCLSLRTTCGFIPGLHTIWTRRGAKS